jgi:hypothetical protein
MTGTFGAGGHIEYRTVWPSEQPLSEIRRRASRLVWESTLGAPGVAPFAPAAGMMRLVTGSTPGSDVVALRAMAAIARGVAALARTIPAGTPEDRDTILAQVAAKLKLLQFSGQTEVACQSIVAYLTIRLGSIAEIGLDEVAEVYQTECLAAATRADALASLLTSTAGDVYEAARAGERLAS